MCLSFSQHVKNSSHHCDTRQRQCIKVLAMLSSPRDIVLYWTPAHQTGVSLLWLAHREATSDAFRAETSTGALDKSSTAAFACEVDHNTLFIVLRWWYNWISDLNFACSSNGSSLLLHNLQEDLLYFVSCCVSLLCHSNGCKYSSNCPGRESLTADLNWEKPSLPSSPPCSHAKDLWHSTSHGTVSSIK